MIYIIIYFSLALFWFRVFMYRVFTTEIKDGRSITSNQDWPTHIFLTAIVSFFWPLMIVIVIGSIIPLRVFISVPKKVRIQAQMAKNNRTAKDLELDE